MRYFCTRHLLLNISLNIVFEMKVFCRKHTLFRIQNRKRKSAIRLRVCEQIEGSGAQKLTQKATNNMSSVQVACNDVAAACLSKIRRNRRLWSVVMESDGGKNEEEREWGHSLQHIPPPLVLAIISY